MKVAMTPSSSANIVSSRIPSEGEKIADAAVHLAAIVAGVIAFSVLFQKVALNGKWSDGIAMCVYAAGFFLMFGFSCAYNAAPPSRVKDLLRRFDYAAIFMMIAGTYTALLSQTPATLWATALLIFVWAAALAGAAIKLVFPGRLDRLAAPLYLALGWAALPAIKPLFLALPVETSALTLSGGLLYSVGVVFHLWESLRFQTAIWHGFVAAAAACQFAGIVAAIGR
jgi:hemolysin III